MTTNDYWAECISSAAGDCGLALTPEQLRCLADSVEIGHDNYGMAFYSPPAGDRIADIERGWDARYKKLESDSEAYRRNAEQAVRVALRQHPDTALSIGEHGRVTRFGGRTEVIQ